ncbi:MAG TPA: hypothetical protein PLK82_06345 [Bacteroidales bacterium]|nr:hypothetical protein [Bacteroidales bacterium]
MLSPGTCHLPGFSGGTPGICKVSESLGTGKGKPGGGGDGGDQVTEVTR